jgi:hypothetical protein
MIVPQKDRPNDLTSAPRIDGLATHRDNEPVDRDPCRRLLWSTRWDNAKSG